MLFATTPSDSQEFALNVIGGLPLFAVGLFLLINPRNYAVDALGAILKVAPGRYREKDGISGEPLPEPRKRRMICAVVGGSVSGLYLFAVVASIAQLAS